MNAILSRLFARTPKTARTTRLEVETLDRRDLPSITLSGGEVVIECDGSSDTVTVSQDTRGTSYTLDDRIVVRRQFGTQVEEKTYGRYGLFDGPRVTSVLCNLRGGTNRFTNSTDLKATVYGGSGRDDLLGGSGQDQFYGQGGTDYLYGNDGNDRLYGGDDTDYLYGGNGTDGLYGGYGVDFLYGNGGSDRYLVTALPDAIGGYDPAKDTMVTFTNTTNYVSGNEDWTGRSWSQTEIELVDAALAVVHETTNGPQMLRYSGDDLTFQRAGIERYMPGDEYRRQNHVLGWNDNDGTITITDYTFVSSTGVRQPVDNVHEVVLHEIGHNWDSEAPQWGGFLALSGWTAGDDMTVAQLVGLANGTYRVSGDGEWVYLASQQEFTRDYARTNPMEDFAECFAAYWLLEMGEESTRAERSFDDRDDKMVFMGAFVDQYTTP